MSPMPSWIVGVTRSILYAVKLKDPDTFFHCCRVGRQARQLARAMGLDEQQQTILEFSGLFHDIGKVGIPEHILLKRGRLEEEEMKEMMKHPQMSALIIEQLQGESSFFKDLLPGIRCHHEKFDGSGYPFNLQGEKIPLNSRIISVVDAVDAMTHERIYRSARSMSEARKELVDFSDIQFDKAIVRIYLEAEKHWRKELGVEGQEAIVGEVLRVA